MSSASLASTAELVDLRARLVRGPTDEYEDGMQRFRRDIAALGPDPAHPRVVAVFWDLWAFMSSLPEAHSWNLPPLYVDAALRGLLENAVQSLWLREQGHVHGSTDNVGHMVLGGIEGTGKTTLLRALSIGVAVLLTRMLPVTHTYDAARCDSSPVDMLLAAAPAVASALGGGAAPVAGAGGALAPANVAEALGQLRDAAGTRDLDVFLVLDEFQHVFDGFESASTDLRRRIVAAADVAAISRLGGTFGVVTGSSADLRTRLFRSSTDGKMDKWRAVGFPDFNGSLYEMFAVPALRTVDSLQAFITRRYPRWDLSDVDVQVLLAHTGGIGRLVHRAWMKMRTTVEGSARVRGLGEAEAALDASREHLRRMDPGDAFDNRSDVRVVMAQFALRYSAEIRRDAAHPRRLLPCLSLPYVTVAAALKAAGFPHPPGVINELVDLSLLYLPEVHGGIRSADRQVQIARPVDAHAYYGAEAPRRRDLLLLAAVQCMVHGIAGEPGEEMDDDLTHVNAGNALEQLVRPRIRDLILPTAAVRPSFTGRRIAIEAGQLLVSTAAGGGAMQRLSPALLARLDGILLVWKREIGLDGVVLRRVRADAWQLYGWQSKGGHRDVSIGGGKLSTSVDKYVEDGTVGGLDDAYIHGILVKAQVGMCKLLAAWHATLPGTSLLPAGLTLTTTKKAELARSEIGKMRHRMRLNSDVARVAGLPAGAPWLPGVLEARIDLVVHDGLEWLRRCLPDGLMIEATDWIADDDAGSPTSGCAVM